MTARVASFAAALAFLAALRAPSRTDACLAAAPLAARWWLTTTDLEHKLAEQPSLTFVAGDLDAPTAVVAIAVDDSRTYQIILGMGSSLEHATCYNLSRLPAGTRDEVLVRLFDATRGIGINLSRICIGSPDFTGDPWYTYDDLPPGQADPNLEQFSIEKDRRYVLPVLKQALRVNPDLKFFASPWSPPGWMKSTGDTIGGHLLAEHYGAYARYVVRFVEAYREEGIPLHAVTVQNEPGVDRSREAARWRYPSCRWTADQERDFIARHLGPAFAAAGLATEIWTYDHNFNETPTADGDDPGIAYPRAVLADERAARYVSGVALHGYAGRPEGMSTLLREFPRTPVHFTEGSVFGPSGGRTLVEYLRHGASSYNGWVTFLDTQGKPNNGPFRASRTCVTLDHRSQEVNYHYDYYQYGHFFRFIQRGALRIDLRGGDEALGAVAFRNPSGEIALVAVNRGRETRELHVLWRKQGLRMTLPSRAITSVVWHDDTPPGSDK